MDESDQADQQRFFIAMNGWQVVQVATLGVVVGLLVWMLTFVFETYVLKAILCHSGDARCAFTLQYGEMWAAILGLCAGLVGLLQLQIGRPLLIAIVATASMWQIISTVAVLPWYEVGLICALLYGLSYVVFTWLARIRRFWVALIFILATVVVVRLIFNS